MGAPTITRVSVSKPNDEQLENKKELASLMTGDIGGLVTIRSWEFASVALWRGIRSSGLPFSFHKVFGHDS
jgi:hypothetical protein